MTFEAYQAHSTAFKLYMKISYSTLQGISSAPRHNKRTMGKKWLPLESNPDVLNDFTSRLGLDISKYSFHDVYGLDGVMFPVI